MLLQVANCADAIKIATDFISVENLAETVHVMNGYRIHRLVMRSAEDESGDDVLQLRTTLWYAWCHLCALQKEHEEYIARLPENAEVAMDAQDISTETAHQSQSAFASQDIHDGEQYISIL